MILCAGESLIDMVPDDSGGFRPLPGGSVYNTAVALGRLGAPASYLWPISRDPFGDQLLARLDQAGVDSSLCPRTERLTTLAFVTLTGSDARYAFYDQGSAGRMLRPDDIPPLPGGVQALFAGGISLVPDPCGAAVEHLIAREHARLPVMLDPNIRPFFIENSAAHRTRLARLFAMAAIVKLSSDDLSWLHPGASPAEAAGKILATGPRIVILTEGAEGATAWWRGDPVHVPAPSVSVADTIGAGDTFNAGFLASLAAQDALSHAALATLTPEQLQKALALGTTAAAITVSRAGADPPWARELDR